MSAPPLCKDCRFSEQTEPLKQWICNHPTSRYQPKPNLVTGEPREAYQLDCHTVRIDDYGGVCGPKGRYWEPRTP